MEVVEAVRLWRVPHRVAAEIRLFGYAEVVVALKPSVSAASVEQRLAPYFVSPADLATRDVVTPAAHRGSEPEENVPPFTVFPNLNLVIGTVSLDTLSALRREGDLVADLAAAPKVAAMPPMPSEPSEEPSWALEALNLPALWAEGLSGEHLVGHLDSGVDGNHPAFNGAIADFATFDSGGRALQPAGPTVDHDRRNYHGTHTAGTIAGRTVQGRTIGVAPGTQLVCGAVLEGHVGVRKVVGSMSWALGHGVRVLSMSFESTDYDGFTPIVAALRGAGILPVGAIGNGGVWTSFSPGNHPEVLSVGACNRRMAIPSWSSSQRFRRPQKPWVPDVVAPGVGVLSAGPNGDYWAQDGTSMAAPHLAGLAAMLFQAEPGSSADDVEDAIIGSASLRGNMDATRAGHGLPDALEALKILRNKRSAGHVA
jgi:subtilisin family serine protease